MHIDLESSGIFDHLHSDTKKSGSFDEDDGAMHSLVSDMILSKKSIMER